MELGRLQVNSLATPSCKALSWFDIPLYFYFLLSVFFSGALGVYVLVSWKRPFCSSLFLLTLHFFFPFFFL